MLADIADLQVGFAFKSSEFSDAPSSGPRLLRGDNIGQGSLRWVGEKYWTGALPDDRYRLRSGDVVVAMDRPWIGAGLKCATVRDDDLPALLVQRVARLRAKPGNAQAYLAYVVGGPEFTNHILSVQTGTAVPHVSGAQIMSFRLKPHPLAEQQAIAEVLGALDDKIAGNSGIAESTVQLADAHFQNEILRAVVERVPLSDVAQLVLGGTPSRSNEEFWKNGTVPWLASGKANEARVVEPTEWITEEALARSAAKMMPRGATLMAITGATLGQIARLEISACGNQSLVGIWADDASLNDWIYFAVKHHVGDVLRHATGAAQQHVNKGDVEGLVIPLVSGERLESWARLTSPLLAMAAQCDLESIALKRTRDTLLPLLMSGKVRVKDVEKQVEEVV